MKTIKLFGDLERFKPVWQLNVETPAEAMRAIDANRDGFLQAADAGEYVLLMVDEKRIESGDESAARQVTIDSANWVWGGNEVLYVMPAPKGQIVAAGAAVVIAGVSFAVGSAVAAAVIAVVLNIVLTIAISFIAQLISGTSNGQQASQTELPENRPSYLMNGVVNTTRQGFRVPLLYGGPLLVGSAEISKQIHTQDVPL